jgi:hypothetical protein
MQLRIACAMSALPRMLLIHSRFSRSVTASSFLKVQPKLSVFEHISDGDTYHPFDTVRKVWYAALLRWRPLNGIDVVSGGQHTLYSGPLSARMVDHTWRIFKNVLTHIDAIQHDQ